MEHGQITGMGPGNREDHKGFLGHVAADDTANTVNKCTHAGG